VKYDLKERHELTEEDRRAIYEHAMRRSKEIVTNALDEPLPEWERRIKRTLE